MLRSLLAFPLLMAGGLVVLQAASPAASPGTEPGPQAAPTEVAPVNVKGSRKVCIRQGSRVSVGSRVRDPAAKVVCKTRVEWQADVDADKQDMQRIWADVPVIPSPTGGGGSDCRAAGLC